MLEGRWERVTATTTDEQLDGLCGQHGKVKSARVRLLFDKTTRQRRGFGFVEMESPMTTQSHRGAQQERHRWIDTSLFFNITITSSQ